MMQMAQLKTSGAYDLIRDSSPINADKLYRYLHISPKKQKANDCFEARLSQPHSISGLNSVLFQASVQGSISVHCSGVIYVQISHL